MSDLISRQAAIDAIERNAYRHTYLDQIINIISNLPSAEVTLCHLDSPCEYQNADIAIPSAQPERKKGRWTVTSLFIKCSECGEAFMLIPQNYCPNCGADMRGEENYERMVEMCDEAGQTKTVAVERALMLYLDDYEEKQRKLRKLENEEAK